MNKVRVLSDKEFIRMENNGWCCVFPQWIKGYGKESQEEMFERLSKRHKKVKIYESTTSIRGYHDFHAMVKD